MAGYPGSSWPYGYPPPGVGNFAMGTNPAYATTDFFKIFPQFDGLATLPKEVIQMFLGMANASVSMSMWGNNWQYAMGLFIAHFCTLHIQSQAAVANPTAKQVMAAGAARGLVSSKSVGGLSVSYDYGSILSGLDGWAAWRATGFGIQLITLARQVGKGGFYVQ